MTASDTLDTIGSTTKHPMELINEENASSPTSCSAKDKCKPRAASFPSVSTESNLPLISNAMPTKRSRECGHKDCDALTYCSHSTQVNLDSENATFVTNRRSSISVSACKPQVPPPSNSSSPNEKRKAIREGMMQLMTENLIEIVCDLFLEEMKVSSVADVINAWNQEAGESYGGEEISSESVRRAVENFIYTLPPRYVIRINSPSEVMLHMRIMDKSVNLIPKSVVRFNRFDDNEHGKGSTQLAFCPVSNGMGNLQLVTISCIHTIGLMELVMGMLVSGGSEILDCDYMLSSKKNMLV